MTLHPSEDQGPLTDAWRRLEWANGNGVATIDAMNALIARHPYVTNVQYDGDCGEASFRRLIDPRNEWDAFDRIAMLFGSYLDNVRAALNYTVHEMAKQCLVRYPLRKLGLNSVEFPIFTSPTEFAKKYWVTQFADEYRQAFDVVQPYDGRYPGLRILHELARKYRHRLVHPMAMHPFSEHHGVFVDGAPLDDVEVITDGGPLKDGDVVLRFPFNGDPAERGVHVYPQVAIAVGIDDPVCVGLHLTEMANLIGNDVEAVLNFMEASFFG